MLDPPPNHHPSLLAWMDGCNAYGRHNLATCFLSVQGAAAADDDGATSRLLLLADEVLLSIHHHHLSIHPFSPLAQYVIHDEQQPKASRG